jgi:hypothetical protein
MSALLAWNNHFSEAGFFPVAALAGINVSSEAYDPAFPGKNALTPDPAKRTRVNFTRDAVAGGYSRVAWTFARSGYSADIRSTRLIAFINVRLPPECTQVAVFGQDHNGVVVTPITTILKADLVPRPGTTDRYDVYNVLSSAISIGNANLMMYVPPSTRGYWEVGHVWASNALVWPRGVDNDWRMGVVDSSTVQRTPSGGVATFPTPARKTMSLSRKSMKYIDALGTPGNPSALSLRQMAFEVGTSEPVIAISNNKTAHKLQVMSTYGLITRLPDIASNAVDNYGAGLTVEEWR